MTPKKDAAARAKPLPKDEPPNGQSEPAPYLTPPKCMIWAEQPDGGVQVMFLVEPHIVKRLRTRAGNMDLAMYLWVNVINPALQGHVY